MQKTIFVVDDSDINLAIVEAVLQNQYNIVTFLSAKEMFAHLEKTKPDMILLDIEMPEMNGFEALKCLKENSECKEIPVIFLTGHDDSEMEARGFDMGVIDFVTKPFSEPVLSNRLKTHLNIDELIRKRTELLKKTIESMQQLQKEMVISQKTTIHALTRLAVTRDDDTGSHIERTSSYCEILAQKMREEGSYPDLITDDYIEDIYMASPLHDIGKVGIPDAILLKPGRLTDEEFAIMKTHVTIGHETLANIIKISPQNEFLKIGLEIARYHHEKWDGSGYMSGISGDAIPLSARIMALSDVYDALRSKRPYKDPFTHEKAMDIIMDGRGKHFDPKLAYIFLENHSLFRDVFDELSGESQK